MIDYDRMTQGAKDALMDAQKSVRSNKHTELTPLHILRGLAQNPEGSVYALIEKLGIDRQMFLRDIDRELKRLPSVEHGGQYQIYMTHDTEQLFEFSDSERERMKDEYAGSEHIFIALFDISSEPVERILERYNVTKEKVYAALQEIRGSQRVTGEGAEKNYDVLKKYTRDFTEMAASGKLDPVIGRVKEINRTIQILSRRTKNNPVLIGEPGVGKTAIVEGLAAKIVDGDIPENLKERRIVGLDIGSLVAGTQFRGEFEQRLKLIINEITSSKGRIILFIDELHTIVGAGQAQGSVDASNMLKPALARGEMQTIGATTLDEYRQHIEKDGALERRFQPVMINEPDIPTTIEILKGLRPQYEKHHNVKITDEALEQAAKLSHRYLTERKLPDKAVDLMDEAAARLKIKIFSMPSDIKDKEKQLKEYIDMGEKSVKRKDYEQAAEYKKKSDELKAEIEKEKNRWLKKSNINEDVDSELIADIVSEWTGIPVSRMLETESRKLLHMEERIHDRVIGQDRAIKTISNAIRRARAGLSDPDKPIGTFLFVGPTGVGKTEVVKALAQFMFDTENAMVRLDMSEYMEKYSVSRLIGAPPGYVGYGEGGQLTEPVRRKPFSVILMDEIEKAHPEVYNVLLQVMDDGRLTDSQGHVVDFRNTILIMTSNIGSHSTDFTDDYDAIESNIENAVRNHFKPEFINRIDEMIVFRTLSRQQIRSIVELQLSYLAERTKEFELEIEFEDSLIDFIADKGYIPQYGARPINRVIQSDVENALSEKIIAGDIKKGDRVSLGYENNQIIIKKV
ncbi:MAG: AAA family ATPase [bacterium]